MLLDECVNRPAAKRILRDQMTRHAGRAGLATLKDRPLLDAGAAAGFDLLLTTDQNLRHQQNLGTLPLRVLVVEARDTSEAGLLRLAGPIRRAVDAATTWRLAVIDNVGRFHVLVEEPPPPSA